MNQWKNFSKGFFKENAVFVLLLGMCPALGVTTSAINGLGMGLATTFVLVMSNLVISLIKSQIPDKVRIPVFIVVIASFVTIVQLTMEAFVPSLYKALGLFIPLIVYSLATMIASGYFFAASLIVSKSSMIFSKFRIILVLSSMKTFFLDTSSMTIYFFVTLYAMCLHVHLN